ncbi:MAG: trypsin-like peptidase domain-containing protein [Deltaproteobacteria bacterium]|nr:trypsin-like peptidase domain-containing protein [Deltaproteobacteria bacterium]
MLTLLLVHGLLAGAVPEDSVVRVQVYRSRPDWSVPWRQFPVDSATGSGFLVEGGYVMTNAHVVANARQVLLKRHHVADPFVARVVFQGDDCDVAVLKVEDPAFYKGMVPLRFGALPKARTKVTTYGFPLGGEEVSSTGGIVSRVEWRSYAHSGGDAHLVVQTDAAINPGNSGGPVWQDGKVVGMAFQGFLGMDNVGFFIPSPVVDHFVRDIRDGTYNGFPDAGLRTGDMISPALKRERRLPAGRSGVVVEAIQPGGTVDGILQPGDVLMAVDKDAIRDDGNVTLGDAQVPYFHTFDLKQVGEPVSMTVLRDGKEQKLTAPSRRLARGDRQRNRYNVKPRYLVHGGLVFVPLDMEYLRTLGAEWRATAPREVLWHQFMREWEKPADADREVVVLARVLKHPVNSQMTMGTGSVVATVNGHAVTGLADLAATLDENTGKYDVFQFEGSNAQEALDHAAAHAVQALIMKTYGIPKDRNL